MVKMCNLLLISSNLTKVCGGHQIRNKSKETSGRKEAKKIDWVLQLCIPVHWVANRDSEAFTPSI